MTRPRASSALCFLACALLFAGFLRAQQSSGDIDRRLYESALAVYQSGKVEQALKDFEQVHTQYPGGAWADDALLVLARHFYSTAWIGDFSPQSSEGAKTARSYLDKIVTAYLSGDRAAEGHVMLGMMSLDPHLGTPNFDEASAYFLKVRNLYPLSDSADDALFGLGYAAFQQNAFPKAAGYMESLLVSYPQSPYVPRALYFAALSLAKDRQPGQAFFYLARLQRDFTSHPFSQKALDMASLLARFQFPHQYRGAGTFALKSGDDALKRVSALRTAGNSSLLAVDAYAKTAARFSENGALLETFQSARPGDILELADGRVAVADEERVLVGGQPVLIEEDTKKEILLHQPITRLTVMSRGSIVSYDSKRQSLLLSGPDGEVQKTLMSKLGTTDPELARDEQDRLWVLLPYDKSLRCMALDGTVLKELRADKKSGVLEQPSAFAFDLLGNVYVLDGRKRAVLIFSPEFELLNTIAPDKDDPAEMRKPTALAVTASGSVLVFDEGRGEVIRYE
jgi:outer membrane protein assembly factor BamD (BamD/ComL family)